jgi:hypothetical protein
MNQEEMFQTPDEVAREVAREIRETKDILRDISRKLGWLETRVKRAYPSAFPPAPAGNKGRQASRVAEQPTLSPQQALEIYDQLVQLAKSESREQVRHRLESVSLPDLALLCRELGVSLGKKKPSRPVLIGGILGRVNESIMLSSSNMRQRAENVTSGGSETVTDSVVQEKDERSEGQAL